MRARRLSSPVQQELHDLIHEHGRITFAQFMHTCLYSQHGGFYSSRRTGIGTHFGTAPMSHPAFGTLIARQLRQMWHLLDTPPVFHLVEVGCGDGALAQSIVHACRSEHPDFARALCYVASDYSPYWLQGIGQGVYRQDVLEKDTGRDAPMTPSMQRVRTAGIRAFGNIVGCILSNELLDNFPVHRFVIQGAKLREIYITSSNGAFVEVVDEPSSPRLEARIASLGITLAEGQRGEICLAIEDWVRDASAALARGFMLTIDYGDRCDNLYSPTNAEGTLVCYHRHAALADPYRNIGEQDITSHVDFTTLMQLGERHGLATAGYALQREFLHNLGFRAFVDALPAQGQSAARTEFARLALMTLVNPDEYGDFKVLAQCKGLAPGFALKGFVAAGP